MNDPATSLTDYAIAVEGLMLAVALLRFGWIEKVWSLAFVSVSAYLRQNILGLG